MLSLFLILLGFSLCHGRGLPYYNGVPQINDLLANYYGINEIINSRNMITVPANCPSGQQLVNGACRDIWKNYAATERIVISPKNVVTAPTNCPDGQELINGVCRDVWRAVTQRNAIIPQNVITAPTNCPDGQELINGVCRDVWRAVTQRNAIMPQNVITAPTNCPDGQELINGVCRDVWRAVTQRNPIIPQNVITVPTNCPEGQELINGVCRDVWRAVTESSNINIKNVVTVPANCPAGQQLINGACRDVWRNIVKFFIEVSIFRQCFNRPDHGDNILRDLNKTLSTFTFYDSSVAAPLHFNYFEGLRHRLEVCNPTRHPVHLHYKESHDVYRPIVSGDIFKNLARQQNLRNTRQVEEGADFNLTAEDLLKMNVNKNIINVPNQCPAGYRPDSNGNCREILI